MILNIYIGTIIFYLCCWGCIVIDICAYMKRHKWKSRVKYTFLEHLASILKILLIAVIPLVNVLLGIVFVFLVTDRDFLERTFEEDEDYEHD